MSGSVSCIKQCTKEQLLTWKVIVTLCVDPLPKNTLKLKCTRFVENHRPQMNRKCVCCIYLYTYRKLNSCAEIPPSLIVLPPVLLDVTWQELLYASEWYFIPVSKNILLKYPHSMAAAALVLLQRVKEGVKITRLLLQACKQCCPAFSDLLMTCDQCLLLCSCLLSWHCQSPVSLLHRLAK